MLCSQLLGIHSVGGELTGPFPGLTEVQEETRGARLLEQVPLLGHRGGNTGAVALNRDTACLSELSPFLQASCCADQGFWKWCLLLATEEALFFHSLTARQERRALGCLK